MFHSISSLEWRPWRDSVGFTPVILRLTVPNVLKNSNHKRKYYDVDLLIDDVSQEAFLTERVHRSRSELWT